MAVDEALVPGGGISAKDPAPYGAGKLSRYRGAPGMVPCGAPGLTGGRRTGVTAVARDAGAAGDHRQPARAGQLPDRNV